MPLKLKEEGRMMEQKSIVCLIDAKNFCFRQHFSHKNLSSRGRPTSILYGVPMGMLSLAKEIPGAPLVFVWDGEGKTWRHQITKGGYKGNRKPNPELARALSQLPVLKEFLNNCGFRSIEVPATEADDVIAVLSDHILHRGFFNEVVISSTDKDFYQLMRPGIQILNSQGFVTEGTVVRKFGVSPHQWAQFRALMGDPSDNIQSVRRGIGPKTAAKMLAAGLDPSVETFSSLKASVQAQFKYLRLCWEALYQNYFLSELQRLDVASSKVQSALEQFSGIIDFYRLSRKLTDPTYDWMVDWFVDYEMTELLSARHRFWRLP